jgi:hypothetical protein
VIAVETVGLHFPQPVDTPVTFYLGVTSLPRNLRRRDWTIFSDSSKCVTPGCYFAHMCSKGNVMWEPTRVTAGLRSGALASLSREQECSLLEAPIRDPFWEIQSDKRGRCSIWHLGNIAKLNRHLL